MLWRRGRAYAQDLHERVFAAADAGQPVGRIAECRATAKLTGQRHVGWPVWSGGGWA